MDTHNPILEDAIVQRWLSKCFTDPSSSSTRRTRTSILQEVDSLRLESKQWFQQLMETTSIQVSIPSSPSPPSSSETSSNDVVELKTKPSHEQILALLIQGLGPAFGSSSTPATTTTTTKTTPTAPPKTTTHSRLLAMSILVGAMEGCQTSPTTTKTLSLSNAVLYLIGTFLLVYCGPILPMLANDNNSQSSNYESSMEEEEYHEQLRNLAMTGLAILLSLPTKTTTSTTATNTNLDIEKDKQQVLQAMKHRMSLAQQALEHRCAREDEDDYDDGDVDMVDPYGQPPRSSSQRKDIRNGLSLLPRSQRALCFTVLESAVKGMKNDGITDITINNANDQELDDNVSSFASFCFQCLQGESDPRCLLQLLQMFHQMQLVLDPYLSQSTRTILFDVAAPYYPIQFTPPPNNPHGITREALQTALVSILCHCPNMDKTISGQSKTNSSNSTTTTQHLTILNLTTGLFLEQLLADETQQGRMMTPSDDYPNINTDTTAREKLDALEHLHRLLFPNSMIGTDEDVKLFISNRCHELDPSLVQSLSDALITVHHEASLAFADDNERNRKDINSVISKNLADTCRTLVSHIAYSLEVSSSSSSNLWNVFVSEPLHKLTFSNLLMNHTRRMYRRAKTSIGYGACLVACGGSRTLRCGLGLCLNPILEYLEVEWNQKQNKIREMVETTTSSTSTAMTMETIEIDVWNAEDIDNLLLAIHGVAALCSSCHVALDRFEKRQPGVSIHPHPLEEYANQAFTILHSYAIVMNDTNDIKSSSDADDRTTEKEKGELTSQSSTSAPIIVAIPLPIRIAAIRAMESLFLATTTQQLDSRFVSIEKLLEKLSQSVVDDTVEEESTMEWKSACSRTLGCLLGNSFQSTTRRPVKTILSHESIRECLQNRVYPKLLKSSLQESNRSHNESVKRIDRDTVAIACSCNPGASRFIVSSLIESLQKSIQAVVDEPKGEGKYDNRVEHNGNSLKQRMDEYESKVFRNCTVLSYVLSNGGLVTIQAYHDCNKQSQGQRYRQHRPPHATILDHIMDSMRHRRNSSKGAFLSSFSASDEDQLVLPATEEEQEEKNRATEFVRIVASHLSPAYKTFVPRATLLYIVTQVSKLLPPLSDSDNLRLSFLLPLLSTAITSEQVVDDNPGDDNKGDAETDVDRENMEEIEEDTIHTLDDTYDTTTNATMEERLLYMAPLLLEYAMSSDYDPTIRSAAATCLHAAIVHGEATSDDQELEQPCPSCPVMSMMTTVWRPFIQSSFTNCCKAAAELTKMTVKAKSDCIFENIRTLDESIAAMTDCLNLASIMGSAAAYRGGVCSASSDKILLFLVRLACKGKAQLPFLDDSNSIALDFSQIVVPTSLPQSSRGLAASENKGKEIKFGDAGGIDKTTETSSVVEKILETAAASAFGSMLSVNTLSPLKKQRLTHFALKFVGLMYEEVQQEAAMAMGLTAEETNNDSSIAASNTSFVRSPPPHRIGLLLAVCHILCCSNILRLERTARTKLFSIVSQGLSAGSPLFGVDQVVPSRKESTCSIVPFSIIWSDASKRSRRLVLACVVKIVCVASDWIESRGTLITGLLRAFAIADPVSEIPAKILALQALEALAHTTAETDKSNRSMQPALVSVLAAALDHPSSLVRQAAVDVRNAWFLIQV